MADRYAVSVPLIENAYFSINPVAINQSIMLIVAVSEQTVYRDADLRYAGELYSGEV